MSRPALHLAHSAQAARRVTVLFADQDVWYWKGAVDTAEAELIDWPLGDTRGLLDASDRLKSARGQLAAARRKLKRAVAEHHGRRWLRVAGEGADG